MDCMDCYVCPDGRGKGTILLAVHRRKIYKPHEISWDSIADEATGKQVIAPCPDRDGRTVVIMRPRYRIRLLEFCTCGSYKNAPAM